MSKRITISMPCFMRPERTKRAIQNILDQDICNWEAFIMGDNCPHFQKLIDSGYMQKIKDEQLLKDNVIHYFNSDINHGGWGHYLTNYAIQNANGKYFIFLDNDDVILPNHMSNYLSEIENTEHVMIYYNSYLLPFDSVRDTLFGLGGIGHCDVIVKTDVAKLIKPHDMSYSHDWDFINEVTKYGTYKKSERKDATYKVMRLGSEKNVDNID